MIGADGSKTTLNDIPKNAFEYWKSGNYAFCLKKDTAAELLKDYSKDELQKLIEIRTPIGYKAELDTLNSLLKSSSKVQPAAETKKK